MSKTAYRETRQRNAIKNAIDRAGRPLGPKEVLSLASKHVPNLGIATVYRNIKAMVDSGQLQAVDIPGQSPRYYTAGERIERLFICERTDKVFALGMDAPIDKDGLPDGFVAERAQVIYYGRSRKR